MATKATGKKKTPRDERYLAYLRAQSCCACTRPGSSQAAHVRIRGDGGTGLKPSDYRALPLCAACHGRQHGMGERSFWEQKGIEPEALMVSYMAHYTKDPVAMFKVVQDLIIEELEEA